MPIPVFTIPIRVFTMRRSARSRSREIRNDLVDSGIAWLTPMAFAHGSYHVHVAPDGDGHIVGLAHL